MAYISCEHEEASSVVYKLLIADDEKQTRDGLAFYFKNNPLGFEVVGVAEGGLSALSMAEKHAPDVVLTDIRMPDLDGFSLAQRLGQLSHKPVLIIMSAYDDVEYFKSAFKADALDYILKPIDLAELAAVAAKTREKLDMDYAEQMKREETRRQLQKDLPALRSRFFADVVDGLKIDTPMIRERMVFLDISLPEEVCYRVMTINTSMQQAARDRAARRAELALDFGLYNLFQELVSIHTDGYVFAYDKGIYGLLLIDPDPTGNQGAGDECVNMLAEVILTNLQDGLKLDATIGIGSVVEGTDRIPVSFAEAQREAGRSFAKDTVQEPVFPPLNLDQIAREKMTSRSAQVVRRVKNVIEENYHQNLSIRFIAETIFLSPNYVCAIFKQETNKTINQYVTEVRIRAAKSLLADPGIRLADIGAMVGYSEPSYFSRIFKRYTALTPKEYQLMLIGSNQADR